MLIEDMFTTIIQQLTQQGRTLEAIRRIQENGSNGREKENTSTSLDFLLEFTGWSETYARQCIKNGKVPCRQVGEDTFAFSELALRTWNRWGRPSASEFYERFGTEVKSLAEND